MTREPECIAPLRRAGIAHDDAYALRRIAMTLHRWHELECGDRRGCIERDEKTDKPFWRSAYYGRTISPVPDRESGAKRRLQSIMSRYPTLQAYIQGDPRGAALYILRPGDVPEGASVDSYYSRGLAVYK